MPGNELLYVVHSPYRSKLIARKHVKRRLKSHRKREGKQYLSETIQQDIDYEMSLLTRHKIIDLDKRGNRRTVVYMQTFV